MTPINVHTVIICLKNFLGVFCCSIAQIFSSGYGDVIGDMATSKSECSRLLQSSHASDEEEAADGT